MLKYQYENTCFSALYFRGVHIKGGLHAYRRSSD